MSKFKSLEEAIFNGEVTDTIDFLWETKDFDQLFDAGKGVHMSALHLYASSGWEPAVEILLKLGANVNVRDNHGNAPLHNALLRKDKKYRATIELLLDKGADINAQNYEGGTPLHNALVNYDYEAASLLIDRGADVDISNNLGITPRLMSAFDKLKKTIP
jgi:ankyrin repeat protein